GDDRRLVLLDEARERLEVGEPLGVGGLGRLEESRALRVEARLEFGRDGEVGREGWGVHELPWKCRSFGEAPPAFGFGHTALGAEFRSVNCPSLDGLSSAPKIAQASPTGSASLRNGDWSRPGPEILTDRSLGEAESAAAGGFLQDRSGIMCLRSASEGVGA